MAGKRISKTRAVNGKTQKQCVMCGVWKSLSNFSNHPTSIKQPYCKRCVDEIISSLYEERNTDGTSKWCLRNSKPQLRYPESRTASNGASSDARVAKLELAVSNVFLKMNGMAKELEDLRKQSMTHEEFMNHTHGKVHGEFDYKKLSKMLADL